MTTIFALKQTLWCLEISFAIRVNFNILPVKTDILFDLLDFKVVAAVIIVAWG